MEKRKTCSCSQAVSRVEVEGSVNKDFVTLLHFFAALYLVIHYLPRTGNYKREESWQASGWTSAMRGEHIQLAGKSEPLPGAVRHRGTAGGL